MTNDATITSSNTSETEEAFIYVFGEWSCLICENKWTHRKTQIHLSKYKEGVHADDLEDNERVGQKCRKCCFENSKLVNYSLLPPKDFVQENLIWNDGDDEWYRVFGTWICDHDGCDNKWSSAHTYILLSKYKTKVAAIDLIRDDHYWGQDCIIKSCKNDRGKLIEYRPLQMFGMSLSGHEKDYCLKCMAGYLCVLK